MAGWRVFDAVLVVALAAGSAAAQAGTKLPLDGAEAKAVAAFFESTGAVFSAGDGTRCMRLFDTDRLLERVAESATPEHAKLVRNPGFRMGFEISFGRQFGDGGWGWARSSVRRIERRPDGALAVYVRQWDADGIAELKRWWLVKHGDGFKITDVESVMLGLSLSQESAAALPVAAGGDATQMQALQNLTRAIKAVIAQDTDAARELLEVIPEGALGATFEGVRQAMLGAIAIEAQDAQTGLAHLAKARAASPNLPMTHYLEGTARLLLQEWDAADAAAVRFSQIVGPDPDALACRGSAARGRSDTDAARRFYRAGLDEDPSSADCLVGLSSVLGADEISEIGQRFKKFPNPSARFEGIAITLLDEDDGAGLLALCDGYRELAPADPNCDYYGAEALLILEEPAKAAAMVERAMDRAPEDERQYYWEVYLNAMVRSGAGAKGYARVSDARFAFHHVAEALWNADDYPALTALCVAHKTRVPDDPWRFFFEAEVARAAGDLVAAETLHLKAHRSLRDEVSLTPLVQVRVALGKWRDAYGGPGPVAEMFPLVASELYNADDGANLLALCALHATAAPTDVDVVLWRAEGHALTGDHAASLKTLEPHRARLSVDADRVDWFEGRWVRSLCEVGRHDEALQVARASTARDGDPWYEVVVLAMQGDPAACLAVMRKWVAAGNDPASFWEDDDVAKALRTPAFATVRAEYPERE